MYVPLDYTTDSRAEKLFRKAAADLEQTQTKLLLRYLDAARNSEVSARHGLGSVRTLRDFQNAVPITGYEEIAEDIARMQAGATRVRFDDPATAFVQTGGNSGPSKVFPRRDLRMGELAGRLIDRDVARALLMHDHPELADGKTLILTGGALPGQLPFGSAHTYALMYRGSAQVRDEMVVDPAWNDALVDAPTRFYVTARLALGPDVRTVIGLAPALLVLARTIASSTETLLRDVRDGTITGELSPEARAVLPSPAPNPELAAALERRAGPSGALTPKVAWPNLALVQCMLSGSLANNRPLVREAYGVPLRETGYSSTEAPHLCFPLRDEDPNVLFGVHTAVCEFVDDDERAHFAHEICVERTYRLVLTTPDGLYRYDTQDLLQVVGHDLGGAPVLRFLGRARVHNLMGEKLSELQVSEAAARAAARVPGFELRQFVFVAHAPRDGVAPHYELRFEASVNGIDAAALSAALEDELRAGNVLYEANRFGGALGCARVRATPPEWFDALRAYRETQSQSAKPPVLLGYEQLPTQLQSVPEAGE